MTDKSSSYGQILRSSLVIGGASALTLMLGLVRSKALALLLGPAGVGLMGLFTAILDVTNSLAGMGVNQSGVRHIAESAASGGIQRATITAYVLRRTSVVLGTFGATTLLLFAEPVAVATFGDSRHANAVRLLGGAVLFALVTEGQSALLQGLRRIGDLAKARVLGALYGTVAVVALTYAFGEHGIVTGMLVAGALSTATAMWYVRRLGLIAPQVPLATVSREAAELLKLGFAFMVSSCVMMGAAYAVRAILSTQGGLDSAGLYQAAWAVGGLYTGFILQAMGTDFYPRLVGAIGDVERRGRLINEQMTASLILAGPGIMATLTLAPLVLWLFYSAEFRDAASTLRWICVGMALRVITWPPGFLIVSMNERWVFMGVELAWAIANIGLTVLLVRDFGLEGAGIAFAGSYVLHGVIVFTIVGRRYRFRPTGAALSYGAVFLIAAAGVLLGFRLFSELFATAFGLFATAAIGTVSLRTLVTILPAERLPSSIRRAFKATWPTKDENP